MSSKKASEFPFHFERWLSHSWPVAFVDAFMLLLKLKFIGLIVIAVRLDVEAFFYNTFIFCVYIFRVSIKIQLIAHYRYYGIKRTIPVEAVWCCRIPFCPSERERSKKRYNFVNNNCLNNIHACIHSNSRNVWRFCRFSLSASALLSIDETAFLRQLDDILVLVGSRFYGVFQVCFSSRAPTQHE